MSELTEVTAADKRARLADARRSTQGKMVALAGAGLAARALAPAQPWIAGGVVGVSAVLAVWWIAGYRRLKAELALTDEYDELDENAAWGGKTIAILFGVFGSLFAFLFLVMWLTAKR